MEIADRKRPTVLALGIILACCPCASALNPSLDINQYAHTPWTVREGFFKGRVSAIAQTPDGYLWLGTTSGLLRFDGVRTAAWQPPAGERLADNSISKLLAARDGRLWIATRRGLASWKDGRLTHYPELAGGIVVRPLEDREGTVWVGLYGPGKLCSVHSGETRCYGEDGRFGAEVSSLYEDSAGNLWVGGPASLRRWKPGSPKLYRLPDPELTVHALAEGDHGEILIALRSGVRRLVNGKTEAISFPAAVRQVDPMAFLRDRDGGLWIGTHAGLMHIHQGGTDFFARADGLSGDGVESLFEDREGNIWAVTNDGGLDRFRDFAANTISAKQGLSGDVAQAVLGARDGSVWIGTENGLEQWKDGHTTIYGERSGGLPDQYVDSIFQDGHGRIWVFTVREAAYLKGGQFVPIAGVPGGYVRDVGEDAPGSLWVSLDQGLLHLVDGRVVERIPWSRPGHKDYAYSLRPDPARGGLWLGFSQGGLAFFKDSDVRASYSASDGLGKGMVGRFQIDGDGTFWAATEGGLSRLRNGRIAKLTSANGLPCDAVRRVIEDDDHAIWLGTSCGLARIARTELDAWANDSKRTVRVTVLDRSDGVIGPPLGGRVAKSTDGKLWFGAPGAVAVIDPWHLPLNKLPPPVVVERVVADRTAYGVTSGLRLPPLSRDLEIDYTALSLVAPEKNRFRVKLEGWDRDWKDAGNKREAFYGNLPPRSYRFRVMASNNSGVWNEAGDWFDFSIAPEYYQTRWFEAAWAAAFLALLWGVYRYRLHQIAREFNVRLEERVDERTRIARELHDTLLQSFQGMMLRFQVGTDLLPPGKAKDTLEQALERGDQAIAEGREAIHDLRSSQEITNDLARAMAAVGEEASAASGSNPPEFRVVVEGASRELHPILRDEIYRIVREAVRNAFRHAQARRIEAEIEYREGLLKVRIRDDGRGMDPEIVKQGRSGHYGVPGMRGRARRMGGKLEVWTGIGAGTEIEPRDEIRRFPTEVRSRVGGGLFRLQIGETLGMHVARPMPMVAPGVSELRVKGEDGIFRVFYFTAGVKGVLVFHAFAKKTQRTPPLEIELAKKRLKELLDV